MKTLFLFVAAWLTYGYALAQTRSLVPVDDSTEIFEPAPYDLRFTSFEETSVTGSLTVSLVLTARQAIAQTGYQSVSDNKSFFSYDDAAMRAVNYMANGAQQTVNFRLSYNAANRPFYPVRMQVALAYPATAGGPLRPYRRDCYIYFTPYNTVEVWDQTDYENLRRQWLTDDGKPASSRVFIPRTAIPVSDIPAGYQPATGEVFDMEYVDGLAYAIPKRYSDFTGYNDGNGTNTLGPGPTASQVSALVYKGQLTNQRIFTYHQPDDNQPLVRLPLRRGRVEVWWDVSGGRDQHVKTFYTDNDGYLTENGSRTVRFSFGSFDTGSLQMYLRIKMQDQWGMNYVWGPSFANIPLTTHTARQPLPYNADPAVFPSLTFGQPSPTGNDIELPETQGLKPFTWVMACRDQVWTALSGNSLQASRPLVVLLVNEDRAYYRANDRAIRLGPGYRNSEFVSMHELGHFVMHDLTRASKNPGPGGDHATYYNNHSPGVTISEGFADGFAFIMDEMTYQDLDRESRWRWDSKLSPPRHIWFRQQPQPHEPFRK